MSTAALAQDHRRRHNRTRTWRRSWQSLIDDTQYLKHVMPARSHGVFGFPPPLYESPTSDIRILRSVSCFISSPPPACPHAFGRQKTTALNYHQSRRPCFLRTYQRLRTSHFTHHTLIWTLFYTPHAMTASHSAKPRSLFQLLHPCIAVSHSCIESYHSLHQRLDD